MTGNVDDFLKDIPPEIRERLASMDPETRLKMMERRREMMESMDDEARSHMHRAITSMRERPKGPEVGALLPE